jgi:hypothetical protein
MSIQQNFPAITPSLSLNFARSKKLDPRITFTRTSSATRTNETGLVEVVPANAPRFDHSYDSVSGSVRSLGLLVEEQRQNLLTGSDYSTNNSLSNVTLTLNATTSPDGTNTALSMDGESSTSNLKYMYKARTTNTTGTYVTSVFLKYKSERFIVLRMNDNTGVNGVLQRIDILNGTFTQAVETGGTLTNASSTITPYPNGWYRISVSGTFNDALTQVQGAQVFLTTYGNTTSTNGVYLWGAQLETGAFPTSYIPTTTSTVTRTADNVSMVGENFSSWYNQSEGSIHSIISLTRQMTTDGSGTWTLDNGNFGRGISLHHTSSPNVRVATRDAVINQSSGDISSIDLIKLKSCTNILKSVTSESISCHNGIFTGITTYSLDVNINRLLIGLNNIIGNPSNNYFNGTISQLTYYPRRLTNAQLQNLTR